MPVEYSDTGFEHIPEADEETIFVLDNFEGDIFIRLHRAGVRIMGPPVIIRCAHENEVLINQSCLKKFKFIVILLYRFSVEATFSIFFGQRFLRCIKIVPGKKIKAIVSAFIFSSGTIPKWNIFFTQSVEIQSNEFNKCLRRK